MKIDADDNNGRGSRLPTPTYGTRPIYTAFAGYSNNERLLCFFIRSRSIDMRDRRPSRPARPARDNAPDNLPLDRQGLARVDSGHEFKISVAAFGVKP
jgi:hypothetical protein